MKDDVSSNIVMLDAFQSALESLRNHLVDLEAVAHAAEEVLQDLPYTPTAVAAEPDEPYSDNRLGMGRLQTLVIATATSARLVLQETDQLVDRLHEIVTSAGVKRGHGSGSSHANQSGIRVPIRTERAVRTLVSIPKSA